MDQNIMITIVSLISIVIALCLLACIKKGWRQALQVFHLFPLFSILVGSLLGGIKLATTLGLLPLIGGIIGLATGATCCYTYIHIGAGLEEKKTLQ